MNVLGISGSPRADGDTNYALRYALEIIAKEGFQIRYITLSGKDMKPCTGCWRCEKTFSCWQDDDMEKILDAMKWCHGLIIGSPVYFGMITGQLKTMMDRSVVMRPNYGDELPMAGKVGAAIACAASRNGGQEVTLQNIHTYFLQMNMLAISDGPNYSHFGATLVSPADQDTWGLETVQNLAMNVVRMLRMRNTNIKAL